MDIILINKKMIISISIIALEGTHRFYQRFLESVSMKAKIEQILGLTEVIPDNNCNHYWKNESMIPQRHVRSRKVSDSSDEFIENNRKKAYQKSTRILFFTLFSIGIVLFIVSVFLTVFEYINLSI